MNYSIYDFIGNIGLVLLIGSYLLLQIGKIDSRSIYYSMLNALAASCLIISICFDFNLSALLVEIFWLLISIYGLIRNRRGARISVNKNKK